MANPIGVVFAKEVRDNTRDRRALASALFYPLLGPVLMVLLLSVVARTVTERIEEPLDVPVVGAERAPYLIRFLEQNDVRVQPPPDDPEAEVRSGERDLVLVVSEGYREAFGRGEPAAVQLVLDSSRQTAETSVRRLSRLLDAYAGKVASQRLLARGISPVVVAPIAVERLDLATPQSQAAQFLNLLPYFLIFSVFIGGMYLAIDTTAGERERGSLEPLLLNPVRRRELVLGKMAAVLVFTLVAVVETLLAFAVVLRIVPLESLLGVGMRLDPGALLATFLITVPLMPLAAALQIIIATFTRSFKEAQNYLSLLPLVPALPGLFLAFVPVRQETWMMLVPTFGQQLLINRVMRGEFVALSDAALSAAVTLAAAAALTLLAVRLYESERVLFGRSSR